MSFLFHNLLGGYQQPDAEWSVGREPAWPAPPWLPRSWEQPDDFFGPTG